MAKYCASVTRPSTAPKRGGTALDAVEASVKLLEDDPQVYAFTRQHQDTELLVVVNCSDDPAQVPLAEEWGDDEVVIASGGAGGVETAFRPWEARVYRRRSEQRLSPGG